MPTGRHRSSTGARTGPANDGPAEHRHRRFELARQSADGRFLGQVSARDLLYRCVARGRDPASSSLRTALDVEQITDQLLQDEDFDDGFDPSVWRRSIPIAQSQRPFDGGNAPMVVEGWQLAGPELAG